MNRSALRAVAVALLLASLITGAVLLWWHYRVEQPIGPMLITPQSFDDYVYYYPTFSYAFREARAGRFPFWNPYQHCGSPFFATAQHLLLYPLGLAFWWLPTDVALKLTNQLHIGLAIASTIFLARVVGLSLIAALSAGITYGFCPGLALLIYVPHHLYGAAWIPLHIGLTHMVMTAGRPWAWALALSFALAAQYLGGYPMFCVFSAYAVGGYTCYRAIVAWRDGTPGTILRRLSALACAFVLAGAWAAPQLLPAMELARQSPRSTTALTIAQADPRSRDLNVVTLLLTTVMPLSDTFFFRPHPHVGLIALVLALLAPLHRRARRTTGYFALLVLFAGLIGVGRKTPLFSLYFHLPTGSWFRIAERFFILVSLGLSLLAGIGVDYLLGSRERLRPPRWVIALAAVASVAAIACAAILWQPTTGRAMVRPFLLIAYVAAMLVWFTAYAVGSTAFRYVLVALIPLAIYLSLSSTFINASPLPETHPNLHRMPPAAAAFVWGNENLARTYIPPPGILGTMARTPSKAGMIEQLYAIGDRENVFPRRIADYAGLMEGRRYAISQGEFHITSQSPNLRLLDLMGVRYVVEHGRGQFLKKDPPHPFPIAYRDPTITIYENPLAKPRAYLAYEMEPVESEAVALARLTDPRFNIDTSVLLEGDGVIPLQGTIESTPAHTVRIDRYEPSEVAIDVATDAPAYLVLTDQFYPGWEATVDGTAVPIHRANYVFRAVHVTAGRHRAVFRFVPRPFQRGMIVTGVVAMMVAIVTLGRIRLNDHDVMRGPAGRRSGNDVPNVPDRVGGRTRAATAKTTA